MDTDFITPEEASKIANITLGNLAQLRYTGKGGLRFYKPRPKTVLYKRAEVVAWIEASAQTKTGQLAAD